MKKTKALLITPLFDEVHSQEELDFLLLQLETLAKNKSFDQLPNKLAAVMDELWSEFQLGQDGADLHDFLQLLEKQLVNVETVTLTLAFNPTQSLLKSVCEWLRTKYQDQTLIIRTKQDENLVAGCILEYQGKHYDLSVANKLKTYAQ